MLPTFAAALHIIVLAGTVNPVMVGAKPGMTISDPIRLTDKGMTPAVGATAKGYLVVWQEDGTVRRGRSMEQCLFVQLLTLDGTLKGKARRLRCSPSASKPTVRGEGKLFLLSWAGGTQWLNSRGRPVKKAPPKRATPPQELRTKCASEGRCYIQYPDASEKRYLDFEKGGTRMRDLVQAFHPQGTLLAWQREPRRGGANRIVVGFVPPQAEAGQPHPVAVAEGHLPKVATHDGRHFALVHQSYGKGPLTARVLTVDSAAYMQAGAPRGPVAQGTVLGITGSPLPKGQVMYALELQDGRSSQGSTTTSEAGAFAIKHPAPRDLAPGGDVASLLLWARSDRGFAPARTVGSEPITVSLTPWPQRPLAKLRVRALHPNSMKAYPQPLSVDLLPGSSGARVRTPLLPGHAHQFSELFPGPQRIILRDAAGLRVAHELTPKFDTLTEVSVPFFVPTPPGSIGAVLRERGDKVQVVWLLPGSPAEQAGLLPKDQLERVDGSPFTSLKDIPKLKGPPGTKVTVEILRQGRQTSFQLTRGKEVKAPPPTVRQRPLSESHVSLPPLKPSKASFHVSVEAAGLLGFVHVRLRLEGNVDQKDAIHVRMTLTDPIGNRSEREFNYYNQVSGHVGCDPVVGGGPDQCKNTFVQRSVAGPRMGFDGHLVREPGVYQVEVRLPGDQMRTRFEVAR